ncbi:MAG: hypothetical protein RIM33_04380 [Alphaproteobacteria bacterium]
MFSPTEYVYMVIFVAYIALSWRIVQRAGYSGFWTLTLLVPFVNLTMIFVFAFSNWPVLGNAGAGAGGEATMRAYTPGQHLNNEGPSA